MPAPRQTKKRVIKTTTKSAYSEKLKHPKWQRKRLEILSRDNFKCRLCSDEDTELHVHHEKYIKGDPWDIDNKYLSTLCKHCHSVIEYFKKEEPELIIYKMLKISTAPSLCIFMLNDSMGITFGCINDNQINIYFGSSIENFKYIIEFYNSRTNNK